jgi:archaellum component FlaC
MSDKTTKEVRGEIGQLRLRITELVDQMSDLQRDLRTFKEAVAEDIGRLNTKIVERRG